MNVRWSVGKAALLLALLVPGTPLVQHSGALQAQAQDGNAVIGRSARIYRSLGNLRADFVQLIDNPMLDSARAKGTHWER